MVRCVSVLLTPGTWERTPLRVPYLPPYLACATSCLCMWLMNLTIGSCSHFCESNSCYFDAGRIWCSLRAHAMCHVKVEAWVTILWLRFHLVSSFKLQMRWVVMHAIRRNNTEVRLQNHAIVCELFHPHCCLPVHLFYHCWWYPSCGMMTSMWIVLF